MIAGGEGYDQAAERIASPARTSILRLHSDAANRALLRAWLPRRPRRRLLKTDLFDEACTDGLLPLLRNSSAQVIGVDREARVVTLAKERHPGALCVRADVRALPFPTASFDTVVSNSTLDHFSHPAEIDRSLAELARLLEPGGELIVTLDNPRHPIVALRAALPLGWLRRIGLVPYFVGATLGPAALARALETAGFEVRELRAIVHFPRIALEALERLAAHRLSTASVDRLLRLATACERLDRLPTRFLTGHFVAALACRR